MKRPRNLKPCKRNYLFEGSIGKQRRIKDSACKSVKEQLVLDALDGTVSSPMELEVWCVSRSAQEPRELAMKSCRAHMIRRVSKITLDCVSLREGTYNITVRNPMSKFTGPLLLNINSGDAINQLGQRHLLPNLSHDQTIRRNTSIPRTRHWLE